MVNGERLPKQIKAFLFRHVAVLTGRLVSSKGLASLRLPVRTMPIDAFAINVKRGVLAYPMLITALARAIFTAALTLRPTSIAGKLFAAIQASKFDLPLPGPRSNGSILALGRTMLATPVLGSGGRSVEHFAAKFACVFCHSFIIG